VRTSASNERFTHWLPLFFGERQIYERKTQVYNEKEELYENKVESIDPFERNIKLLRKSICFITQGSTKKDFKPEMVIEVLPKLIITHLVDLVDAKKSISIVAIRRLFSFFRLFRLLMALHPEVEKTIDADLEKFVNSPDLRIKDHFPSLGDLLTYSIISKKYNFVDIIDGYL